MTLENQDRKEYSLATFDFNEVHGKLVNNLMRHGKKQKAERVVNDALEIANDTKANLSKEQFLLKAVENALPSVETRSVRLGGSAQQVPHPIDQTRSISLAVKWLVLYARRRSERGMSKRLAAELTMAFQNQGGAVRKRDEVHKSAEANRANSHRRWGV
jgi:small subunit ribosomal protein S7